MSMNPSQYVLRILWPLVRRYRRSRSLAPRLTDRHMASNHGVECDICVDPGSGCRFKIPTRKVTVRPLFRRQALVL